MDGAAIKRESKCADADWAPPKILALRDLHTAIDEALRDAYGWSGGEMF